MSPRIVANFLVFQAAWFGCVLTTAAGHPMIAAMCPAIAVAIHCIMFREHAMREMKLIATVTSMGLASDLIACKIGLLGLPGQMPLHVNAIWFASLWAGFATCLNASMAWLQGRHMIAAAFGLVAGPLSYWAGVRLQALEVNAQPWCWVWVGAEWAIAMPVMLTLAARSLRGAPA